jgi:hypothetical protein
MGGIPLCGFALTLGMCSICCLYAAGTPFFLYTICNVGKAHISISDNTFYSI